MANNPKKIKDPTEAALSAIQEALSIRDSEPAPATPSPPPFDDVPADEGMAAPPWRKARPGAPEAEAASDPTWHATGPDLPTEASAAEVSGLARRPANDDRESIGQILRSLQRRPARISYLIATVFAVVWALAGLLLGWM